MVASITATEAASITTCRTITISPAPAIKSIRTRTRRRTTASLRMRSRSSLLGSDFRSQSSVVRPNENTIAAKIVSAGVDDQLNTGREGAEDSAAI